MTTVLIDDKKVRVKKGTTILSAAQKADIWIPTLCYHPSVSHITSCRICIVELDHGDKKELVTACSYPIMKNLTVHVSSKKAIQARKGIMELLLARSPESEELRILAKRMGVTKVTYPKVTESQRGCILCGRCALVCEELIGQSAIGFTGRGNTRVVTTPFRVASENCIGCGACVAVCPVGTIQKRKNSDTNELEISPYKSTNKLLVCEECGVSMVSESVFKKMDKTVKIDWKEFRNKVKLCPKCRRLQFAGSVEPLSGS